MYAMLHQFLMTLQNEILSTVTSDFLKQKIILKSFNSLFNMIFLWMEIRKYFLIQIQLLGSYVIFSFSSNTMTVFGYIIEPNAVSTILLS